LGTQGPQGNCINVIAWEVRGSPRPYGTRKRGWDAIPGLRYTPPWAIFVPSLREECDSFSVPGNEWNHLRQQKSFMRLPWQGFPGHEACYHSRCVI
jgi:hypothetical protein